MAAVTPDIGQGLTWSFGTYSPTNTPNNTLSIRHSGLSRETYNGKHLGTTGAQPFLVEKSFDPGELELTTQFDSDADITTMLATSTLQTFTITWPDGQTFSCSAHFVGADLFDADEGVMETVMRFKISTTFTV